MSMINALAQRLEALDSRTSAAHRLLLIAAQYVIIGGF